MRITAAFLCLIAPTLLAAPPSTSPAPADDPLQQAITLLHQRGLPATFADLKPTDLPDDRNAALDIYEAVNLIDIKCDGPSSSALEYGDQLPYPKEWFALAQRNAAAHTPAVAALHRARLKNAIAWDNPPTAPIDQWLTQSLPHLSPLRELANIIADLALYQHFTGDDPHGIETLADLEFLGHAVAQKPLLVSKLVAIGIWAKSAYSAQIIATGIKLQPAQRQTAKALMADLLNDQAILQAYRAAISEERTLLIEEIRGGQWSTVPIARTELPQSIQAYDALISAADKHPWEEVKITPTVVLQAALPSLDRVRSILWRNIVLRRMAGVGLACGLYRHDHSAFPASLQDLVPNYLPSLPPDPYARDGAPLRYVFIDQGKRPLIGSVGPDGQPNQPDPHRKVSYGYYVQRGEPDDIWIDLSDWHP